MRGKIAIAALSLSAAAVAADPRPLGGSYSRYIEDSRVEARARHDRLIERSDAIARQAVASICSGCLGLRLDRLEPSPPIDTALLVAGSKLRQGRADERRAVRRTGEQPGWKAVLLAHLIRD